MKTDKSLIAKIAKAGASVVLRARNVFMDLLTAVEVARSVAPVERRKGEVK